METRKEVRRKTREGVVVSNKMDKTVTVSIQRKFRHPQLQKVIMSSKKYYAHHELETIPVGARVRIQETRPLSKLKCWRVLEVLGE